MNEPTLYRIERVSVVDLVGRDAGQILHNLTTNEIRKLEVGQARETFVTDIRGKTLHHVMACRTADGYRLIGPHGVARVKQADGEAAVKSFSQRLAEHCDRYTIREDASPVIRDADFVIGVADPFSVSGPLHPGDLSAGDSSAVDWIETDWLGAGTRVGLIGREATIDATEDVRDEACFHARRVLTGFPWYGVDLDDGNLPQEADRDAAAIDFGKGCYLGQETVARLDALGQVQRKLVTWAIGSSGGEGSTVPGDGDTLIADGKKVARLTSVASAESFADATGQRILADRLAGLSFAPTAIALGFARRSHFDLGSRAAGPGDENSAGDLFGEVIRAR